MSKWIFISSVVILFVSCNGSDNGKYVVYSVVPDNYGNDTIINFLKSSIQGGRYDIVFQDKFVSIKSLKSKEDYLLPKEQIRLRVPTYSNDFTKQNVTTKITLYRDTALIMEVRLSVQHKNRIHYDSPIGWVYNDEVGTVKCLLFKVDE